MRWQVPSCVHCTEVDTLPKLESQRTLLKAARVISLDAEWLPFRRGRPEALLVQLGVWAPAHVDILLVDLLGVPAKTVQEVLQDFLLHDQNLLVGYGLRTDLLAIGFAPSSSCLKLGIDLKHIQLVLEAHRIPGLPKPGGPGLSALVEAYLGKELDKSQQCSDWGARPLSKEQKEYAAADAACLLELVGAMVSWYKGNEPLSREETPCSWGCRKSIAWPALPATCLRIADEWKDCRSRILAALKNRPKKKKCKQVIEDVCAATIRPTVPCRPPRFVCDVMVQGLARQLRLVGVDAEAMASVSSEKRHITIRRMVEAAEEQQRVILTRDRAFVLARYSHAVYWVRSDNKRAQLLEILKEFDLEVPEADLLSRCAKCNGEFIPRPLSSEEIPTSCNVPAGVLDRQDEFFMCAKCESVYWKGSQYAAAMGRLTKMTASFTLS